MKKMLWLGALILIIGVSLGGSVFAISKNREKMIEQNCSNMRHSLKDLQKSDVRNRIYLGTNYETLMKKFILPLNLRLVEESRPESELVEAQAKLQDLRVKFMSQFTNYSQHLEELLGVNCQNEPLNFDRKLNETRKERLVLKETVAQIEKILEDYLLIARKALE